VLLYLHGIDIIVPRSAVDERAVSIKNEKLWSLGRAELAADLLRGVVQIREVELIALRDLLHPGQLVGLLITQADRDKCCFAIFASVLLHKLLQAIEVLER
jgi:hypothetical protein